MHLILVFLFLAFTSCVGTGTTATDGDDSPEAVGETPTTSRIDADGDGYADDDCDDADSAIHPAAEELCNQLDDDCDGSVDEDFLTQRFYVDTDGDDYGVQGSAVELCSWAEGYSGTYGDCADADSSIHPGEVEFCDGKDNDCDGTADEDEQVSVAWWTDMDLDGYGHVGAEDYRGCVNQSDPKYPDAEYWSRSTGDCDDADASVNPSANNC